MSQPIDRAEWINPNGAACDSSRSLPARARHIILLGAPGIGKGTQAELLSQSLGCCHLSTGDIFRAAKGLDECALTPSMRQALGFMKRGELVPDEIVIQLVAERIRCLNCPHGFLLDGFPRTVNQAEVLDKALANHNVSLDAVLSFELDTDKVIERLSGRRTCSGCKTTFHIKSKPPRVEGICDKCGGALYQREDDRPDAIAVRLRAYHESTAPLEEYYDKQGLLRRIDADGPPDAVFNRAMAVME